ncbi:MAG TPA: hypothetical protein VI757_10870, partial [Bacteroidia bacterium]|nr:hypothetical protein [Bacteroidia bacterium]
CSDPYHYGEKDFGTGVGLQYGQDVRVCDIEFNSVTGIMSNEHNKSARVEFNLRRTNITPFGKCFGLNENDLINLSVNFAMYNDGWRLQPNDELKKVKRNLINKIVISDQSSDKTKQMAENNKTEQIDKNEMRPIAKTRKFKIDDHEPTTEEIESEKMIIDSIAKAKGINVSKDRCLVLIGNWNGVFVSNGSRKPIQPCKIVQDNNGVKFITGEYAISTNGSYLVFFNGKFRGQYTGMTGSSGVIPPATNFSITLDKEGKLLLTRVGDFPNRYYEYTRTK